MTAAQSRCWTMISLVMLMVLGLLATTAVNAHTTYPIQWAIPPNFGALVEITEGALPQGSENAAVVTIEVGDTLRFQYNNVENNLLEVTDSAIKECDNSAPLREWTNGDTSITFLETGIFCYICGIPDHCLANQRLTVEVTDNRKELASSDIDKPLHPAALELLERREDYSPDYSCDGTPFTSCNESSPQTALQWSHILVCLLLALGSMVFFY